MNDRIEHLAAAARPINDADWGSEAQILAENALFDVLGALLPKPTFARLNDVLMTAKATSEEMIDAALKVWSANKEDPNVG